jgi:hypothetical protein
MDNSFAIWHELKNGQVSTSTEAELHFNLWQFSSQKNSRIDCLDIGIKIAKISSFASVNLFVPFSLNENDVRDLGKTITSNTKLLTAIFNEFGTVGAENAKLVEVTLNKSGSSSSDEIFKVYVMEGANFELEEIKEGVGKTKKIVGTTIKINTTNINHDDEIPVYLRLRIDFPSQDVLGKILHQHSPKDSWLQSSTENKQFVDFRLNEKRNLPKQIQEKCADKFLNIGKVHFFLMREFADELSMSDPDHSRYRVLENDIWSDYFSEKPKLKLDHMLAYHWKFSSLHNNNFTLSTKFSFQESSNWKILIFLFIAFLLGVVGGVGGNFLTRLIDAKLDNSEKTDQVEPKSINSPVKIEKLEK